MARSVLQTAIQVLSAVSVTSGPRQIADIARTTGIPYSTAHRVLAQLQSLGMVARIDGRYVVGAGVLELADSVEPIPLLRRRAVPILEKLRLRTGASIALVADLGDGPLVLDIVHGPACLPCRIRTGTRVQPDMAASQVFQVGAPTFGPMGGVVYEADKNDPIPNLTCYAVQIPLPDGARAALQISSLSTRPAAHFAKLLDSGAARIGAVARSSRRTQGRAAADATQPSRRLRGGQARTASRTQDLRPADNTSPRSQNYLIEPWITAALDADEPALKTCVTWLRCPDQFPRDDWDVPGERRCLSYFRAA